MAFHCDINDEFIEVDQFHSDGRSHAMFSRIGHQPSRTTTYFAYVGLDIMPGGTDHELYFFVLALDDATGEERRYFSGVDTRRLISSPEDRSRVLRVICEMTSRLLHIQAEPCVLVYLRRLSARQGVGQLRPDRQRISRLHVRRHQERQLRT